MNLLTNTLRILPLLLLAACAGPAPAPETDSPRYAPIVSDLRAAPFEISKALENGGVRFYLGDEYLGAQLMEVLHRQVAIKLPKQPRQHILEVTDLELSTFVSGGNFLVDPTQDLLVRDRYYPAPGSLVLEDLGAEATTLVRARISYRLDGQPFVEEVVDSARIRDLHQRAGELYVKAIERMLSRVAQLEGLATSRAVLAPATAVAITSRRADRSPG